MNPMNLDEFVSTHAPRDTGETFELENSKLLDVSMDGTVMAKAGSMVGYTGNISFERKSAGGLAGMLKKRATGEGAVMMQASGSGHLYLADRGKEIQILELDDDDGITVNGNDVLAFEDSVGWDIEMMSSIAGTSSGGLFNVLLEGPGHVAITTHGKPLVVSTPVSTDPNATVAWSNNVSPGTKRDLNVKGFLGRSSGETFQLHFSGTDGFVIIQPYEESGPDRWPEPTVAGRGAIDPSTVVTTPASAGPRIDPPRSTGHDRSVVRLWDAPFPFFTFYG